MTRPAPAMLLLSCWHAGWSTLLARHLLQRKACASGTESCAHRRHVAEHEAVDGVLEVALDKIGIILRCIRPSSVAEFKQYPARWGQGSTDSTRPRHALDYVRTEMQHLGQ